LDTNRGKPLGTSKTLDIIFTAPEHTHHRIKKEKKHMYYLKLDKPNHYKNVWRTNSGPDMASVIVSTNKLQTHKGKNYKQVNVILCCSYKDVVKHFEATW